MTRLLLDAGNTFIKWCWDFACEGPTQISPPRVHRYPTSSLFEDASGPLGLFREIELSAPQADGTPVEVVRVWASSVLGHKGHELLQQAFNMASFKLSLIEPAFPGFESRYKDVQSLGRDRWAASLAVAIQSSSRLNLTVSLGTATTIDCVKIDRFADQGLLACHLGGVILPGFDLMSQSLAKATKQLPLVQAADTQMPCTTDQAIGLGILQAQVGAVRQMSEKLQDELPGEAVQVWITGGAADLLQSGLGQKAIVRHNLVLEGVWHACAVQEGKL